MMKKIISLMFVVIMTIVCVMPLSVSAANDTEQLGGSEQAQYLVEQLHDLYEEKEKPNQGNYTIQKDVDLNLKIMLVYMGEVKKIGAEQYLTNAINLVEGSSLKNVVGQDMKELKATFNSWKATPTTAIYETMQKDVSSICYIINADAEKIAKTNTTKIIIIIAIVALAVGLIMKGLSMKRR